MLIHPLGIKYNFFTELPPIQLPYVTLKLGPVKLWTSVPQPLCIGHNDDIAIFKSCSANGAAVFHLPSQFSQESHVHHPLYCAKCSLQTDFRGSLGASLNILGTHLAQTFLQPQMFPFLHTFASPIPSLTDTPFRITRLSFKTISLTRCALSDVCAVCGVPSAGAKGIPNICVHTDELHCNRQHHHHTCISCNVPTVSFSQEL
jgi:hypothetical protein